MAKTVLILPDQHAHPDHNNNRADWAGQLIVDLKPDVVINMGDAADMPSLSAYDKGKATFKNASYQKDIESHLDFQDRLWAPMRKAKRKTPYRVVLWGNHENRQDRVLDYEPHLKGDRFGLSPRDFDFSSYYHEEVRYEGSVPGIYNLDGVLFAHYFISGVMGRPIGGVNHASSLLAKNHCSCVQGHSHTFDFSVKARANGDTVMGLVAGVYQDYKAGWAGAAGNLWQRGLCVLHNFENGQWDLEWISMKRMRDAYAN